MLRAYSLLLLGVGTLGALPREVSALQSDGDVQAPEGEVRADAGDESPGPDERDQVVVLPEGAAYHSLEAAEGLFSGWLGSGLAERIELGASSGGRPLLAVQFGGRGPLSLRERRTILLLGGLDGNSAAGTEAVISVVGELLGTPEKLPPSVTFVALPWANPDGLARWAATGNGEGCNDRPVDEDRDGRLDEDGPDDMDGDGHILDLLIEDPDGPWARCVDERFLRPARPGDSPRYSRSREGRDDDGDGRYNEDEPGGVCLDRNFPVHWSGPWEGSPSGTWPLSEPVSRSLADFALLRRTVCVLMFQGAHGLVATPGGVARGEGLVDLPFEVDAPAFERVAESFARATSRPQEEVVSLFGARGVRRPGAALDWFYAALGALAVEVSVWGPQVERNFPASHSFVREGRFGIWDRGQVSPSDTEDRERAWAAWLDDTRGGIGFVDWVPVELGGGTQGLVGGWERFTRFNPPGQVLPQALEGMEEFVLELAQGLPNLEIEVLEAERQGGITYLRARVRNRGWLPSGLYPSGGGTSFELEFPEGVTLIAGEPRVQLGHLPGESVSADVSWLLAAPEGTVFRFRLESSWTATVEREVRAP